MPGARWIRASGGAPGWAADEIPREGAELACGQPSRRAGGHIRRQATHPQKGESHVQHHSEALARDHGSNGGSSRGSRTGKRLAYLHADRQLWRGGGTRPPRRRGSSCRTAGSATLAGAVEPSGGARSGSARCDSARRWRHCRLPCTRRCRRRPARAPVVGMCRPGNGSYACLSGDRPGEGLPASLVDFRLEHPPHPAPTAESLKVGEALHDLPIAALFHARWR